MSGESKTLDQLLDGVVTKVKAQMYVARPGLIERYDASQQQADVRPVFREPWVDADGVVQLASPVLVSNVPVVFIAGGGGYLTFPIQKGDGVLLVYLDRSADRWKSLGQEVDPVDVRRHHPSDAIAIAGLNAFPQALQGASSTDAVLNAPTGGKALLGSPEAVEPLVLGQTFNTTLTTLLTALKTWAQAVGVTVAPATATFVTAITAAAEANYLSDTTRTI